MLTGNGREVTKDQAEQTASLPNMAKPWNTSSCSAALWLASADRRPTPHVRGIYRHGLGPPHFPIVSGSPRSRLERAVFRGGLGDPTTSAPGSSPAVSYPVFSDSSVSPQLPQLPQVPGLPGCPSSPLCPAVLPPHPVPRPCEAAEREVGQVGGVRTVRGSSHPPRTRPMETTSGLGASFQKSLQPLNPRDPPDGVFAVTVCSRPPMGNAQHLATAGVNGLGRLRACHRLRCHFFLRETHSVPAFSSQPDVVIDRDTDTDTEACVCIEKI